MFIMLQVRVIYFTFWCSKIFLLLMLVAGATQAQQHHYWDVQYGARANLMGGAVIAGVNDNSAIYYNPGAIASLENMVSVNATTYQLSWFDVKNGLGNGIDINSFGFDLYPQFAGGVISFKNPKIKASYALLTKDFYYLKLDKRHEMFYDAIPAVEGQEEVIASFEYLNRANEQWAGIGIGYQLSKRVSIGLSQFLAYRFQNSQVNFSTEVVTTDLDNFYTASVKDRLVISLDNFKAIWKMGVQIDLKPWLLGVTFTSPSVNFNPFNLGTGRARREVVISNLNKALPDPLYANLLATDQQSKIPTLYKSPMAIGLGVEYYTANTKLAFAAEYFAEIARYPVLSPQSRPVVRPSNVFSNFTSNEFLAISNFSYPIANVGVGIEQKMGDKWSLLAGARTDISAYDIEVESNDYTRELVNGLAYWDLFHFSLGATLHKKQSDLTIGLNYYVGSSYANFQYGNVSAPLDRDFFESDIASVANTTIHSVSVVVGYTHFLKPRK